MYGINELLTRLCWNPGFIFSSTSSDLCDDHQVIRIRVKCAFDELIRYMWTIIIARIDVIDASRNRLSQHGNRTINIPRWTKHTRTSELHCAITHPLNCRRAVQERE